jgi:hypothetical protein
MRTLASFIGCLTAAAALTVMSSPGAAPAGADTPGSSSFGSGSPPPYEYDAYIAARKRVWSQQLQIPELFMCTRVVCDTD